MDDSLESRVDNQLPFVLHKGFSREGYIIWDVMTDRAGGEAVSGTTERVYVYERPGCLGIFLPPKPVGYLDFTNEKSWKLLVYRQKSWNELVAMTGSFALKYGVDMAATFRPEPESVR